LGSAFVINSETRAASAVNALVIEHNSRRRILRAMEMLGDVVEVWTFDFAFISFAILEWGVPPTV
jgi:hypothetical protein